MPESHHTIKLPAPITLIADFICFLGNTRDGRQNVWKCPFIGQSWCDGDGTLEKYNGSVEINVNDEKWSLPLRNERQTVDLWFPALLSRQSVLSPVAGGWAVWGNKVTLYCSDILTSCSMDWYRIYTWKLSLSPQFQSGHCTVHRWDCWLLDQNQKGERERDGFSGF